MIGSDYERSGREGKKRKRIFTNLQWTRHSLATWRLPTGLTSLSASQSHLIHDTNLSSEPTFVKLAHIGDEEGSNVRLSYICKVYREYETDQQGCLARRALHCLYTIHSWSYGTPLISTKNRQSLARPEVASQVFFALSVHHCTQFWRTRSWYMRPRALHLTRVLVASFYLSSRK